MNIFGLFFPQRLMWLHFVVLDYSYLYFSFDNSILVTQESVGRTLQQKLQLVQTFLTNSMWSTFNSSSYYAQSIT